MIIGKTTCNINLVPHVLGLSYSITACYMARLSVSLHSFTDLCMFCLFILSVNEQCNYSNQHLLNRLIRSGLHDGTGYQGCICFDQVLIRESSHSAH